MDVLETEAGSEGVALFARIKAALDPEGLVNPGKMLR